MQQPTNQSIFDCLSRFDPSFTLGLGNLGAVITMGEFNTMAAGRVLERPGVTYVSPNALSPMLDNNRHLVRSIAPTSAMMKALADLLSSLGMTYVDVVYENTQRSYHTMDRLDYYTYDARSVSTGCKALVCTDLIFIQGLTESLKFSP